ncbi:MAG: PrpF domain-containing protein [Chloroflexota bacterium]
MPQIKVPAAFYRGGTSRAVIFREADLAQYSPTQQDAIILAAMGSPDPYGREIDGLGGGISSLSKVAIVGLAATGSGADVTFRFGQVDVERPVVEYIGTCGNISSAIGPFAVDEGMVEAHEPLTTVRVLSTNTRQHYLCHVPVRNGRAEAEGDYVIDGVPGPAAQIALEYLEPGGSLGGDVLPTGRVSESLTLADGRTFTVSLVDAANPMVFVRAADLGATATELPEAIDADRDLSATLDAIRDQAAVTLGLATSAGNARERTRGIPKVVMVAPATDYTTTKQSPMAAADVDLVARMLSMSKCHRTMAGTGAMCTAVAALIEGTVVAEVASERARSTGVVRIGHPAGMLDIGVSVERRGAGWFARSVSTFRSARRVMDGFVYVPSAYLDGRAWYERQPQLAGARG